MTEAEFKTILPIADADLVYRQAFTEHLKKIPGAEDRRFPSDSHFKLKPGEDGLSVNWNQHIDIEGVFHIISLSFKKNTTEYKDPKKFSLFTIPVEFIRGIDGIEYINHNPVYNGNPAPVGLPNNYSHSLVIYPDDEEIRLKLSDYCQQNHEQCFCPANWELLDPQIEELRGRLDDTPYHRLPDPG